MEIRKTFGLNGPNIWANSPVLEAWVDLGRFEELPTDKLPGFSERLMNALADEQVDTRAVWRSDAPTTLGLVGLNAVAAILIISHPQVPHFGGVKHWLPSMPFLGILAGVAVTRILQQNVQYGTGTAANR